MAIQSVWIEFNLQCRKCGDTLPVNCAAELFICLRCKTKNVVPQILWSKLITKYLIEATGMEMNEDSWADGYIHPVGAYRLTFGRCELICKDCGSELNAKDVFEIAEKGEENFTCSSCGSIQSVRKPPEWFRQIVPHSLLIVGETIPYVPPVKLKRDTAVSFHCYHCGASLKLDGSSRTIKCNYCGNDLTIPDEIWRKFHHVLTSHRWFVFMDLGESVKLIPDDISKVNDVALLPGDEAVLLWDSYGEGSCIGRTNKIGGFKWLIENITITTEARLFYVKKDDLLWVIGTEERVLCFNATSGDLFLEISNEDNDPNIISVFASDSSVVLSDNTIIIYRGMPPEISFRMRRYDGNGKRIPLWKGYKDDQHAEKKQEIADRFIIIPQINDWDKLPDQPLYPPADALLEPGPNGSLYFIHSEQFAIAEYDSFGKLKKTIQAKQDVISEIIDAAVAPDGSVFVVFEHRKKVGHSTWDHFGVMKPDGSFEILVGPYAPVHNFSIGEYGHKIAVSDRGSILICGNDFNYLWVFERDGSIVWQSPGTLAHKEERAYYLKEEMNQTFFKRKRKE